MFFRRFAFPYGFESALSIDKVALVAVVCLAKQMQLAQNCASLVIFPRVTAR